MLTMFLQSSLDLYLARLTLANLELFEFFNIVV